MPVDRVRFEPLAREAARRSGIDEDLFVRQITQESGWNSDAYNEESGASGLAQIVVRWHPSMAGKTRDPIASLDYAADLMASHLAYWSGNWTLALSSYNAGRQRTIDGIAGKVDGWPYAETVAYVRTILDISESEARRRLTGASPVPTPVYNPAEPTIVQNDNWSCAPTATRWALRALGRAPSEGWIESQMLADRIVSVEQGLLDGSGRALARWITEQYAEPTETGPSVEAFSNASASFDDIKSVAGTTPVLAGGHGWGDAGHWTGVRRYDADRDVLVLANPGGTGPVYGQQTLNRQQFAECGPWSSVILRAKGTELPPPAPVDRDARIRALAREILSLVGE